MQDRTHTNQRKQLDSKRILVEYGVNLESTKWERESELGTDKMGTRKE